ncbi:hypothetical protein LLG95_06170 [bacterium]|nr:hypothetical protein [bacterium]
MKTHEPTPARPPERFSTIAVLIGLAVIWVALFIVFKANTLSTIRIDVNTDRQLETRTRGVAAGMQPRDRLLLPAKVHLPSLSRQQAIKRLASDIDLRVPDADLARLDNEKPIERDLPEEPIVMVMHQLIGDRGFGLAVSGDQLRVIKQQLRTNAPGSTQWLARIEMDRPEISIAPLPDAPLWITLRLEGAASLPLSQRGDVELEVWRGATMIGMARSAFDARGHAAFELAGSSRIRMSVQRIENPTSGPVARFDIDMTYYSAEAPAKPDAGGKGK